ncbi:MAG: hypothetical protein ACP5MU_01310 [Thermoplasmata archaeon]
MLRVEVASVLGERIIQPKSVDNSNDFKRKRKMMIIVLVISITVSSIAYLGSNSNMSNTVNIMSVTIDVFLYGNNTSAPLITAITPYNHETFYGGSTFTFSFNLTNNYSGNITLLPNTSTTPGFVLKSFSPALPLVLRKDRSDNIEMRITTPNYDYAGNLDILLYAE